MKKILLILLLVTSLFITGCGTTPDDPTPTPPSSDTTPPDDPASDGPASDDPTPDVPDINEDEHSDENDDGKCDDCGISVIVLFDFYAINDMHGKFADTDNNVGVDELTTYLKNAYKTDDNVILLSSGDMWQGSSESNLTKGLIITEWMNELDFASMTLGNHEYDWGEEFIEANLELAEFPFLAINVYDRTTNERADYCAPSVMIERGGVEIGIIGAIGDCYSSILATMVEDVYFKTGSELTALVKAESERLRAAGADYIVYSLHDGYGESQYSGVGNLSSSQLRSYYDVTLSDGYVDLVFEGHTHQRYVMRDEYGVYHLQNGGENKGISHAEIRLNFANGNSAVSKAEFVSSSIYDSFPDDEIVENLMGKYEDQISIANKVVGYNNRYRSGDELRQMVADLYYKVGVERWGDEYDIVLGGGFLSVRSPYNLAAGEVTYSELQSIFPFDNQLVLCSIQGRYLKSKFFETTNSDYFISYGEYGESIKDNIDPNATYYIIIDTYSSSYAPNHATVIAEFDANTFARDLLAEYFDEVFK